MGPSKRLFVAVEVPPVAIPGVGRQGDVPQSHVTLKFLGDVEEGRVGEIGQALEKELAGAHGGKIVLQGLGGFPSNDRPRVLWVGITEGREMLSELGVRVERAMAGLGFPREDRPFVPHLTVARLKYPDAQETARRAIVANHDKVFATGEVSQVLLKESHLLRSGAEHLTILVIPLGKPPS
jgi:2'-5' RNA ligase